MAYDELDNRDLNYDETDMFDDDSLYEPSDTFGEQIGESSEKSADGGMEASDDQHASESATQVEDAFGETLNDQSNPHLADQLNDRKLEDEATADYQGSDSEE
jgi:hypothetical protein